MKFLRFFTDDNNLKTGYFDGEKVVELSDSIINILNNWEVSGYIENNIITNYSIEDIAFAPVCEPTKIICVGLNYKDHAQELGMELPSVPKIFLKPPSSIIASGEDIIYPSMSNEVDFEAELAIVISKTGKDIDVNNANDYIGGYTIINDVTARDIKEKMNSGLELKVLIHLLLLVHLLKLK